MAGKATRGPAKAKYKRATTPALTEQRKAWGKKWGKLVSDSVKASLRGKR